MIPTLNFRLLGHRRIDSDPEPSCRANLIRDRTPHNVSAAVAGLLRERYPRSAREAAVAPRGHVIARTRRSRLTAAHASRVMRDIDNDVRDPVVPRLRVEQLDRRTRLLIDRSNRVPVRFNVVDWVAMGVGRRAGLREQLERVGVPGSDDGEVASVERGDLGGQGALGERDD